MSIVLVIAFAPVPIRRDKGATITFINQNAGGGTDIFLSEDRGQLAASAPGTTPQGTKLAAGGTALQYPNFSGLMWARSAVDTIGLEVLP